MSRSLIRLKTSNQVLQIAKNTHLLYKLFLQIKKMLVPGMTGLDINIFCSEYLFQVGAKSVILGYKGFPAYCCISVNSEAVHGIPKNTVFEPGDLVSVDLTIEKDGYFSDAAWTFGIGEISEQDKLLVNAAYHATLAGALAARAGKRVGTIGQAVEDYAKSSGFRVVRDFAGHGVGFQMHEEPLVLHHGPANSGPLLKKGMVLTIEPVLTSGSGEMKRLQDGWTEVSTDGKKCAQFELTVEVTEEGGHILTFPKITSQSLDTWFFF